MLPAVFCQSFRAKGQEISEWRYEVALPKVWTKKFEKFFSKYSGQNFYKNFVHILGNGTTPYFHSEISRPLGCSANGSKESSLFHEGEGFGGLG